MIPDLDQYVKTQRARGYSDSDLRLAMEKAGYDDKTIDEHLARPMHFSKIKGFFGKDEHFRNFVIVAVISCCLVLAVLFYVNPTGQNKEITKIKGVLPKSTSVFVPPIIKVDYNVLGMKADKNGEWDLAEEYFRKAVNENATAENLLAYGKVLANKKNYSGAQKYLLSANSLKPNNFAIKIELGWNYFHLWNFTEAEKVFLKLQELSPTADVYNGLGWVRYNLEDYQSANKYFSESLSIESSYGALLGQGFLKYRQRNLTEAANYFKKAYEIKEDNEDVQRGFALVYMDQGNLDKAKIMLDESSRFGNNTFENCLDWAKFYYVSSDYSSAKSKIDECSAMPIPPFVEQYRSDLREKIYVKVS